MLLLKGRASHLVIVIASLSSTVGEAKRDDIVLIVSVRASKEASTN